MFLQKKLKEWSHGCVKKIESCKLGKDYFELPYKHVVIDNFFDEDVAENCLKSFPDIDDRNWEHTYDQDI